MHNPSLQEMDNNPNKTVIFRENIKIDRQHKKNIVNNLAIKQLKTLQNNTKNINPT